MKIVRCSGYDELSRFVAGEFATQIKNKGNSVLGLATGSTPVGTYRELCGMYERDEIDFSGVVTFNLDEYYPLAASDPNSYHSFMEQNLFSKINVKRENIHIPNGEALDADAECIRYEESIAKAGGIDLQLLGIGVNGHIGFNEPSENLEGITHKTSLTEETIDSNARFFKSREEVPRFALTMGIGSILKAKKIIIAANGVNKREAVEMLESGKINTQCPATLLNAHPDVTLVYSEN